MGPMCAIGSLTSEAPVAIIFMGAIPGLGWLECASIGNACWQSASKAANLGQWLSRVACFKVVYAIPCMDGTQHTHYGIHGLAFGFLSYT